MLNEAECFGKDAIWFDPNSMLSPRILVLGVVVGLVFRLAILACVDYPLTGVAGG